MNSDSLREGTSAVQFGGWTRGVRAVLGLGRPGILGMLLSVAVSGAVIAAPVVYTVDPAKSTISMSGKVIGFTLEPQGPGSLTTSFAGSLTADKTDTSITFVAGGQVKAMDSGTWEPAAGGAAGSAPANYGGKAKASILGAAADATAAARNVEFNAQSAALPISGGGFDSSALRFQFPASGSSVVDYVVTGFLSQKGGIAMTGLATNGVTGQASLVTSGTTETLTLPIDASLAVTLIFPGDVVLNLKGQIVATRTIEGGGGTSTFEDYLASRFPGVTDPAIIGAGSDQDGDGLPLFVEFAFGLDPSAPNAAFAPLKIVLDPGDTARRILEYARPTGVGGITYRFESSTDAILWSPIEGAPEVTDLGGGTERLRWVDTAPVIPGAARLVRLTVSKP